MDSNIIIQIIVTLGTVIAGIFATYKYSISESIKREKVFLDYIQGMQDKQLAYYSEKNGHLERISKMFSEAINKNTRTLDKLSARIK